MTMGKLSPDDPKTQALRHALEERIEAAIAVLDWLDGDPDLEDGDPGGGDVQDEPHDAEDDI